MHFINMSLGHLIPQHICGQFLLTYPTDGEIYSWNEETTSWDAVE